MLHTILQVFHLEEQCYEHSYHFSDFSIRTIKYLQNLIFFSFLKTEIAPILKVLKLSQHFGVLESTTHASKLLGQCLAKIQSVPISILADQFPGIAWQGGGSSNYSQKAFHMQTFLFWRWKHLTSLCAWKQYNCIVKVWTLCINFHRTLRLPWNCLWMLFGLFIFKSPVVNSPDSVWVWGNEGIVCLFSICNPISFLLPLQLHERPKKWAYSPTVWKVLYTVLSEISKVIFGTCALL